MKHYRINDALNLDQFKDDAAGTLQLREDGLHFRRRDGTDFLLVRVVPERVKKLQAVTDDMSPVFVWPEERGETFTPKLDDE